MTKKPEIGARVMFPYGRREYIDYGEVGTITSHGEGRRFTFTRDDYQPFARWMFGSKAKLTGHAKERKTFSARELKPLAEVYAGNANRFRSVAEQWDRNAEHEAAPGLTTGQEGENDE